MAVFFVTLFFLLACILRITVIGMGGYANLQSAEKSEKIKTYFVRGSIYDCNGLPITNSKLKTVAAVLPLPAAADAVLSKLSGEEYERVSKLLKSGKPAVCTVDEKIDCEGIKCIQIPVRVSSDTAAHHAIGYTDSEGNGISGLEYAYNDLLSGNAPLTATFATDGKGRPLLGVAPQFSGGDEKLTCAVYSTLDINVQKAAERAAQGLLSGAVVVADCKTNKIRAMVSLPDFSPDNVAASLQTANSPLVNKCLSAYNVGSAFKPCIAAQAIKSGMSDFKTECTGSVVFEDRLFNCHKRSGHGMMNMSSALAMSCNCYFYNLSTALGAEKLRAAAGYFAFGNSIKIADNIKTESGNIAKTEALNSDSALANFGIGQGSTMITPVGMLTLYSAIANGGCYYLPSLVEKTVKNGTETPYDIGKPTRAIDSETADILKLALREVVTSGTGVTAGSEKVTSAGKTATAQTGRKNADGTEITNSWFCGFFPAEDPRYTVIIMTDGKYDKSPTEVFKTLSEELSE